MQQKWGCSGGLRTVTMCLFLIIYPVIITILAKIKHTHTHTLLITLGTQPTKSSFPVEEDCLTPIDPEIFPLP